MSGTFTPRRLAALIWAAPCSLIGLAIAPIALLRRGSVKRRGGTLEIALRRDHGSGVSGGGRSPFDAITFGHVLIATTSRELERWRSHELVHVRQYERWGAFFLVAYGASSLWQWLRGRHPYRDNRFEVEAFARDEEERRGTSAVT